MSKRGLDQMPNPGPRKRADPKKLPKREGELWATVTVLSEHATSPSVQCNNCSAQFCGGATRITAHITGKSGRNSCTCESQTFLELKEKLLEKEAEKNVVAGQKQAETEVDAAAAGVEMMPPHGAYPPVWDRVRNQQTIAASMAA